MPPSNISAATATPISPLTDPVEVPQLVSDSGTTYTVWYTYTATADEVWLGAWAFGDLVTYRPTLSVWLGPTGAPVSYLGISSEENAPVQFPVDTGVTYYLKIAPNAGNPAPATLTLSMERGPQYTVPVGAIAVNDDTEGFPLVFLDPTTGAVLNIVRGFPAGEAADVLATGEVCAANMPEDEVAVYSAAYTLVGTQSHPAGDLFGFIRAHSSGKWYVGNSVADEVRTITAGAAFGPATWHTGTGSVQAVAANQGQTRLFLADHATSTTRLWDMGLDASDGPFVAFPAGFYATDILVLADGTVLIAYTTTSESETRVVHYTTAAVVLHTYTFTGLVGPAGTPSRIASAIEDPEAFWIWTHHGNGESRFRKIQVGGVSDGTALVTLTTTEFEVGGSQAAPVAPPATPARFGHSYSCPFWVGRAVIEGPGGTLPPGGGGGGGGGTEPPHVAPSTHLDARYIRRLRRAPHVANDNTRVFVRRFEVDLERGQGLPSGQGSDPVVLLRLSRDGGQTWGEEIRMHAGALGAYTQRCLARRLGQARDTVFEVTVSDPIAWSLVGAWLDLEPGAH